MVYGNRDIAYLLELCSTHLRVTPSGRLIGLDWRTILDVADRLHIPTDAVFMEKLRLWELTVVRIHQEEQSG